MAWTLLVLAVGLGALMTHIAIIRLTEWSYEPKRETPLEQRVRAIKERPTSFKFHQDDFDQWTGQIERERKILKRMNAKVLQFRR